MGSFEKMVLITLPETNNSHLKMDGWKTIVSHWDAILSGKVAELVFRGRAEGEKTTYRCAKGWTYHPNGE